MGGSSAVNGLAYAPPSKATIDAWAKLGNAGWDWTSFSKSLARGYKLETGEGSGPLNLAFPVGQDDDQWAKTFQETLGGLGHNKSANPFDDEALGAMTIPDTVLPASRTRSYAANAYLLPAASSRKNLTVHSNSLVQKIVLDSSTPDGGVVATAVLFTDSKGNAQTVSANKEVILAAGALGSPKILELSGVGNAKHLKGLGIDVVIDNPNVGEHLQNHTLASMSFEAYPDMPTMDDIARQDPTALAAATEQYAKQAGPFSKSGTNNTALLPLPQSDQSELKQLIDAGDVNKAVSDSVNGGFTKALSDYVHTTITSPERASAAYIMFPVFTSPQPDGSMGAPAPGSDKYISVAILLSHPLSTGSVHVASADSAAPPTIDPRLLSHPLDAEVLARHLIHLDQTITSASPLAGKLISDGKRRPAAKLDNLAAAKRFLRESATGAYHYTSSCAMMSKDLGGVVDDKLRVYGTKNLRVCDASVIPILPRSNPQATVYGVAEHAVSIIQSE